MSDNMRRNVRKPAKGWWTAPTMTLDDIFNHVALQQLCEHSYDDFTYPHDVFVDDVWIGEVAEYDEIGPPGASGMPPLRVGFLSIHRTNPVYCRIHSQFAVKRKTVKSHVS